MTTTPVAHQLSNQIESGIRPFDLTRDLRPVATLISNAFAHELDNRGTAILREMRFMSYLANIMRFFNGDSINYDDVFSGFVWVENGKVVGNVTVQRADNSGKRWQIANVAVDKKFRGRGIASRLIAQAIAHIRKSQGSWAVLQVYENNTVARSLYENLGFENMGGNVEVRSYRTSGVARPVAIRGFGAFNATHWRMLYDLALSQPTAHAQWWRTMRRSDFQMSFEDQFSEWFWRVIGRSRVMRRCIRSSDRFEAAIVLNIQRWHGEHSANLWVRPEHQGKYEMYLAQWMLGELNDYPRFPISITLSSDHAAALEAFERFGFKRHQSLLTMRRRTN